MDFSDKVVLVTGGSSGIGAAIALTFAKKGAKVAIVGRNEVKLASVAAGFSGLALPLVIRADIAYEAQAVDIIDRTIKHFGKLDVLVNNAGIARNASILEGNVLAAYDEVMATNLRAPLHLTTLAAPHLMKTKGNIINISSVWGLVLPEDITFILDSMSKSALNYLTKGAAVELGPHGVRVNAISPGPVRTDILKATGYSESMEDFKRFTVLDRVSEPEEIAELVLFLAADTAKSITGSNVIIDNGMVLK